MPLLLLFVVFSLVETFFILKVGSLLGFLSTFTLILLTGIVGSKLAKREGLRIWLEIQSTIKDRQIPKEQLIEGVLILLAGLMLVFPGFISDVLGLGLLYAPSRHRLIQKTQKHFKTKGFTAEEQKVEYEILD